MPDLDKIERRLHRAWRPVYELVKGGQPLEDVGRAVLKALARRLREGGGITVTGFAECVETVQRYEAGQLDERSFDAVVGRMKRRMDRTDERLLARAAGRLGVGGPAALLQGPPAERLLQEFLKSKIENELFSQQRDYLVGKRFGSRAEAVEFETKLLGRIRRELGQLATRLTANPKAKGLKAPSLRGVTKKTTEELIDEPLV